MIRKSGESGEGGGGELQIIAPPANLKRDEAVKNECCCILHFGQGMIRSDEKTKKKNITLGNSTRIGVYIVMSMCKWV
jgi:hypothetical protein